VKGPAQSAFYGYRVPKIGTKFNGGIENFLSSGFSVLVVNPEGVKVRPGSMF
jgi:hypothetical protein